MNALPDPQARDEDVGYHGAVTDFKRRLIEATLHRARGNRTHAARSLGLQRTYLLRLIRELRVAAPPPPSRHGAPRPEAPSRPAETPALRVETATSSGAAALYAGVAQVAANLHRTVLVVGGEKMTHLPTPRVSEIIGRSIDPYERAYGATMPALAGLVTRALMARKGVGVREIAQVAVKNHANAARNPYAHFQKPVTLDEVMESRMVADPLRLLHCCPISDGAAAVVLTAERSAVRVAGIGQGADALAVRHRADVTHFRATRDAARAAFAMAGFGPARVDFAEIHDAFAPFELISLEDLGLVPPGKAGRATLDGETALDGRLPVNPSGGLKGRGHPLAATGLAQVVECVWQLTGRAGERQVEGSVALAHSIGGLATNNWVTILESER